ncbi:MAG: DNA-3-methyladenine glycosylase I [Chloroflexi bacterium]|nr:DNA-3-methyladenine glycosylase I [Chloroflexota bacterium]
MPEMQAPDRIEPKALWDYLDVMSRAVLQSGISWRVVESKWPGIREAFHGFDAASVAGMDEAELEEVANDTRVIRNRRKLAAVVTNAQRMIELEDEHGSFKNYLRAGNDFGDTVTRMRKDFKFLGEMGCYYMLYVVGEKVPDHDEWEASRKK